MNIKRYRDNLPATKESKTTPLLARCTNYAALTLTNQLLASFLMSDPLLGAAISSIISSIYLKNCIFFGINCKAFL